jgi:hypothetical protein
VALAGGRSISLYHIPLPLLLVLLLLLLLVFPPTTTKPLLLLRIHELAGLTEL